ncbi:ABC transporter ATP-binding protein [Vibrio viridaestus]|uniref:ABC transporter ATP-binding protein n=1 Tax=Vibrio viridaestus TaxID=2487322 RepID=A0A3N9TDV0_9VIBR|nr:ABC transporter ATP-binding protein [Vibrio viridaestus]
MGHLKFRLHGENIVLGYDNIPISKNLDVTIPDKQMTVIIGPNGCGKSTLLNTLCRLTSPINGQVTLDNKPLKTYSNKEIARQISLLPQSVQTPDHIRVRDLVSRGRYPHQSIFHQWSHEDEDAVMKAMEATNVTDLADKPVTQLSGGQAQRVWIATILAQQTPIIFLDEPTTFLDIAHQIDVLRLCRQLVIEQQKTVITVLHDINQACRYADYLVVVKQGEIIETGTPNTIINEQLIEQVFGIKSKIIDDPVTSTPMIVPFE